MAKPLKCVVVTPERAVLDETANFIVLPMSDGELGVAEDRLPLIGRLGYGELRLTQGEAVMSYYIDGGFVQVRDNVVTVLTPRAIPASDIKIADAENALKVHAAALTPEAQTEREKVERRARAQLRIAAKAQ